MLTPLAFLLQGLALGVSAAASPGPFQAYVIGQTLAGGWRRAAPVAFAPLVSDGPIILLILVVLGRLPGMALRGISIVGGVFVLYLAWTGYQGLRRLRPESESLDAPANGGSQWSVFRKGVLMNVLNPSPYTFWTLVNGPLLISALRLSASHAAAFLAAFYGTMIAGTLALVFVFHQARRLGPRLLHRLALATIILLAGFGGLLIARGVLG